MDAKAVVQQALEAGVALYLQEGKLAYKARRGEFPEALKALVRLHKTAIECYLSTLSITPSAALPELTARGQAKAPLSFAQERLWAIDRLTGRSPHYNLPFAIELQGECRADLIHRAIAQIVARHEALRTSYVEEGQEVYQVISADYEVPFATIDLSALPSDEQQAQLDQLLAAEAGHAFDLRQDVLLRSCLVRRSEDVHILLVNMHHIAADGWSIGLLVREFSRLYEAYAHGEDNPLPPLALQYSDYAQWQSEHLSGAALDGHLAHWLPALADLPQLHGLRTDWPRPPVFSFRGAAVESRVERGVVEGLQRLGQRTNATLFIVMQAAMAVLLHRYSGERSIVIGTVVANREQTQIADLIGCFINMLVFKYELNAQASFADLLGQVREQVLDGMVHQQLPFEMLVEKLRPARTLSHSPLFQVALLYQNNTSETFALPGLSIRLLEPPVSTVKYDVTLVVKETPAGLRLSWEYASDLFEASTIARMAASFDVLLQAIVAAPKQTLHALPVLDTQERARALLAFNDTTCDFPDQALIHELIEATVAAHPDATAVAFENQTLSYAQLNARANQVAHALLARGVRPDDRVAICAERSLELMIGLLGILKSGAAYVPLDPGYPPERLAYMLQDCAPIALVTQAHILPLLPAVDLPLLRLDDADDLALLAAQPTHDPDARALGLGAHNLAYVIYTSGSTGLPKGAMNEHQAVVNRLLWAKQEYALGTDDRVLQKTPFGFDVSVWEFFLPLLAGARLVLARPGGHQEPDYLVELIASAGVTTLHFVPSMLPAFLAHAQADACRSIRRILCSGEALPFLMQQQVMQQLPHVELHNLYGPTEAAIDVTSWRCEPGKYEGIVPIGRPIANIRIYILDAQQEPVPVGAPGELYIAGVGVARGYLNRPELTRERFVADRFGTQPDAKMYKTGDLARWLPDGNIEYLGRNDFQVKIRGFRVELGEIETRLGACAGVREAVVIAREDNPGDQRLVAYLVMEGDTELKPADLRTQLSAGLPDFMIPSAFVAMDSLPLTPNGKLDRKALPVPDISGQLARQYVPPSTDTQHALCEIWQSLLKLVRVGIDDNFFEIGGHSLLGARMLTTLNQQFGVTLHLKDIFELKTVGELARHIDFLTAFRRQETVVQTSAIYEEEAEW